ncbi:MAG: hypothetical protein A3D92_05955 [Bacteroidetes bacterium RIFCSPHIGHO2_02_FULL_44_7]|nr:MAG: hypothetical protein A3D92_05955 [Bacteroidetes bacterium RIFCSPHIGHO2_02_FULL_44_7]
MNQHPPFLNEGDLIVIVAPAKAIEVEHVQFATAFLKDQGFEVMISAHCLGKAHYFSGSVEERRSDFQSALNDPTVKAILCARGGYGCVQLVDDLDWSVLEKTPKWIIGFSDVTVFHQRLHLLGHPSIHGTMPLNFSTNTERALSSLIQALTQPGYHLKADPHLMNVHGRAHGLLIGGNLSILYSLLGTNDQVNYSERILFVEDLAEHLYALDRMLYAFKKAGVLQQLAGFIVGGMTDMKDTAVPFGRSLEEIILEHVGSLGVPVVFNFPCGHVDDNLALRFGESVRLNVDASGTDLTFGA